MQTWVLILASSLAAGTVLSLAALGLLVNEKVGVINLGAEGMMLCAALAGVAATVHSSSYWLGFLAGIASALLLALLFGVLVIWLGTNQVATGLALTLFGAGFSAFAGTDYVQAQLPTESNWSIPGLSDLPVLGPILFQQHPLVYASVALTVALVWVFQRTRLGLVLRSVGENPQAAHALGYNVRFIRLGAVLFGGAMCGLAGSFLSLAYSHLWAEGMVAGKGWIALALTTFATWHAPRILLGAWLFGGVTMLQFHLQAQGVEMPSQLLIALPYLATIAVLAVISRNPQWIRLNMPASLGQPFSPH